MRSFSKGRLLFLVVLLVASVIGLTWPDRAVGQPATPPPPGAGPGGEGEARTGGFFTIVKLSFDAVSVVIILCSVAGVALIIQGFIKVRRPVMMPESSSNHIRELIGGRQFKELIEFTETDPSFVSKSLNPALKRAPSFSAMKEAMETAVAEQTAEQFRKIEYLNILGNLGPLLGLLGTVVGMIDSFSQVYVNYGKTDADILSLGIAKALAHTFMGLALAIPCLAAFGTLRTMVDRLTVQGALQAEELLLMIKPAEAKPAATAPRPGPAVAPPPIRKAPIPAPPVVPAQG
jgi:biopolymer transport protein ExbB